MSFRAFYRKLSRPYRKMIGIGVFACVWWVAWRLIGVPFVTRGLINAVHEGNLSKARCLLMCRANPNQAKPIMFWDLGDHPTPQTALDVAAFQGRTDMARLFLDNGAAINHLDALGRTALVWAVLHGPSDTTPLLLARGADVHVIPKSGDNLVYTAVASKIGRQLALFMDCGIDINAKSPNGGTAFENAVYRNSVEEARILLEHGVDWKNGTQHASRTWIDAARNGDTAILKLLIEHGTDVNDNPGVTALEIAAICQHTETVRFLLECAANPNVKTESKQSILDSLEHSANPDVKTESKQSLLAYVTEESNTSGNAAISRYKFRQIALLLRKAGAK